MQKESGKKRVVEVRHRQIKSGAKKDGFDVMYKEKVKKKKKLELRMQKRIPKVVQGHTPSGTKRISNQWAAGGQSNQHLPARKKAALEAYLKRQREEATPERYR